LPTVYTFESVPLTAPSSAVLRQFYDELMKSKRAKVLPIELDWRFDIL
jgi:hypothetical protein